MQQVNLYSAGFSLLEVLIAFAMVSGVLLGIVALQNAALNQVYSAYQQNIAVSQSEAMMERLRCSDSAAIRDQQFNAWLQELPHFLSQASADYQCLSSNGQCTVNIYWQAHGLKDFSLKSIL